MQIISSEENGAVPGTIYEIDLPTNKCFRIKNSLPTKRCQELFFKYIFKFFFKV